jgi:hypothetical protein
MNEWEWAIQEPLDPKAEAMADPCRCTYCGKVYDLGHVHVTARYADCSIFRSPCCGHLADDRTAVSLPSFTRLRKR